MLVQTPASIKTWSNVSLHLFLPLRAYQFWFGQQRYGTLFDVATNISQVAHSKSKRWIIDRRHFGEHDGVYPAGNLECKPIVIAGGPVGKLIWCIRKMGNRQALYSICRCCQRWPGPRLRDVRWPFLGTFGSKLIPAVVQRLQCMSDMDEKKRSIRDGL